MSPEDIAEAIDEAYERGRRDELDRIVEITRRFTRESRDRKAAEMFEHHPDLGGTDDPVGYPRQHGRRRARMAARRGAGRRPGGRTRDQVA